MPLELPAILGRDAAGEVVRVGAGVTAFKEGDHVLGLVNGAYAQFVVAAAEAWAKLPAALLAKDAGALPLVLLTGDQLIEATLGPSAGAGLTVLVTGALGEVGRVAVWGIRQRGARVLAGVRSKQVDEAKSLDVDGLVALDDDARWLTAAARLRRGYGRRRNDQQALAQDQGQRHRRQRAGRAPRSQGTRADGQRAHGAPRQRAPGAARRRSRGRLAENPDLEALPAGRGARGPRTRGTRRHRQSVADAIRMNLARLLHFEPADKMRTN